MSDYNLWDYSVWEFVMTLTILLTGMLAANAMLRLIKPLRKLLIPGSVLGGFLLLGIFCYASLAFLSWRRSIKTFEQMDL